MTDARFPEQWLNRRTIQRLSDHGFRGFIGALAWSAANRTDGVIRPADVDLVPWFDGGVIQELIALDLAEEVVDGGWLLLDFEMTQTTAAQLAATDQLRLHEREKKRRQRAHAAGDHSACTPSTCSVVPRDVPRDVPQDKRGQDRTGQDRPGQAATRAAQNGAMSDEPYGWEVP